MATMNGKDSPTYYCPVEATLDLIGGNWKVLILFWLKDQTHRFGELWRKIPDVSERMLTQQLRELENHGIVHRMVYAEVPLRVKCSLTDYGCTLRPITELMCEWGQEAHASSRHPGEGPLNRGRGPRGSQNQPAWVGEHTGYVFRD